MESSGRLVILLIAGVIVAFAAIAIRNRMSEAPVETRPSNRVITAKRDIPPGTIIQGSQDIDWMDAPENANKAELLAEGSSRIEDFGGAVVRRQLRIGEPVPANALTKAGDGGFMSAVLEPGMRAVSIAVNQTSGNAGFISPGDRVDLIVTRHVKQPNSADSIVSNTFIYDVRVLAVDQMLDNPENKAILAKTVTVEVTPRQAEQISVAAEMGKISVALRSLTFTAETKKAADKEAADSNADAAIDPVTDLFGSSLPQDTANVEQPTDRRDIMTRMRVIRGDQSESVEFY